MNTALNYKCFSGQLCSRCRNMQTTIQILCIVVLELNGFFGKCCCQLYILSSAGEHTPVTFHQPTSYTSDQAASHAAITNGKLENERVLFSAAGAFLGYDLFIQETGEIVREMQ